VLIMQPKMSTAQPARNCRETFIASSHQPRYRGVIPPGGWPHHGM
jgi:hypothetical protein